MFLTLLKDAKHYAYVAPTVYQFAEFVQIYCNVAPSGCVNALLVPNEFISSLVFGYTLNELDTVLIMNTTNPP